MNKMKLFTLIRYLTFTFIMVILFTGDAFAVGQNSLMEKTAYEANGEEEDIDLQDIDDNISAKEGYLITFPNVSIIEYIRFISEITKKNFIFKDEDLRFNVTILSEEPTSIENIIAALIQILRIHGLSLLEQGNNLIIHKNKEISQVPKVTQNSTGEPGIITRVFQLKNVKPETILRIVRPMISSDSVAEISKETRHLIVTDVARNIKQIARLLKNLDTPNVSLDIGYYTAEHSRLETLVKLTEKILIPLAGDNPLVMVPQRTSNTIYIVSTPYLIDRTLAVMATLDIQAEESSLEELPAGHIDKTNFYIHKLQYHKGENIVTALQSIGETLDKNASANEYLTATIQSVQWLETTNSLLFTGDNESLKKIRELVENLDIALKQVLIEILVIDASVTRALDLGVEWGGANNTPKRTMSFGSFNSSQVNSKGQFRAGSLASNLTQSPPLASSMTAAQGFSFGAIGSTLVNGASTYNTFGALVKALETDDDTKVLINPKILTLDGTLASLFVGETAAYQSSQSVNDEGSIVTVNVEYRDVGTKLEVTPFLGPDNIVTLEIDQEISEDTGGSTGIQTGATSTVAIGPVSTKSTTKTKVQVPNGSFLVISGMIRDYNRKTTNKIPCLGSTPYVGDTLFGSNNTQNQKRNLLIFLRPHIVSTQEEMDTLTRKQKQIFERKVKKGHFLEKIDNMMK